MLSVTHHGRQPIASNDGGEGTTLTNDVIFIPGRQEQSGKPLVDTLYTITTADGQTLSGKTDALGRTVTVQSKVEENLQLSSPEAPPKPKKTVYRASGNTPVEYVMEFTEK